MSNLRITRAAGTNVLTVYEFYGRKICNTFRLDRLRQLRTT
jgi:hypothetical protein